MYGYLEKGIGIDIVWVYMGHGYVMEYVAVDNLLFKLLRGMKTITRCEVQLLLAAVLEF
jgi:hypothetical protein